MVAYGELYGFENLKPVDVTFVFARGSIFAIVSAEGRFSEIMTTHSVDI